MRFFPCAGRSVAMYAHSLLSTLDSDYRWGTVSEFHPIIGLDPRLSILLFIRFFVSRSQGSLVPEPFRQIG